jgi:hypothetical protein
MYIFHTGKKCNRIVPKTRNITRLPETLGPTASHTLVVCVYEWTTRDTFLWDWVARSLALREKRLLKHHPILLLR